MNKQMSDSYKKEVDEFKKWADNSLGRCEDFSKGISPRPRYERPYEPPMSVGMVNHDVNSFTTVITA